MGGGGEEDGAVGLAVGVAVVMGKVSAGVKEVPLPSALDHGVWGVEEVAAEALVRRITFDPGLALGALPVDAIGGVAGLNVDGLGV